MDLELKLPPAQTLDSIPLPWLAWLLGAIFFVKVVLTAYAVLKDRLPDRQNPSGRQE